MKTTAATSCAWHHTSEQSDFTFSPAKLFSYQYPLHAIRGKRHTIVSDLRKVS